MKNVLKAFGVIVLVAIIGFSMAACGGDDSGENNNNNNNNNPSGNGKNVKYEVSWGGVNSFHPNRLGFNYGSVKPVEWQKIWDKIQASDIVMSGTGSITLGTKEDSMGYCFKDCVVNTAGTIKITIKPVLGYNFVLADWKDATDTITVP